MSPTTRSRAQRAKEALNHVLKVLDNKKYDAIFEDAGIEDMDNFLLIDINELKSISILDDETTKMVTLNLVEIGRLKKMTDWFELQGTLEPDVWLKFNDQSLKEMLCPAQVPMSPPNVTMSSTPKVTPGILSGVKRNINEYPKLRDDKMWMSFNRTLLSLAATHDLSEVFDPSYVPTNETMDEFKKKNTFVYSVFTHSLISAKSKVPLRAHESTRDAQAVYRALLSAYADGTAATLSAEALETQLCGMKLDNSWQKSYETFLHTWSARLYDLESVRDDVITIADRKRWLINSIRSNSALYQGVNTSKSVEQAMKACANGTDLPWEQFFNIILDHAQNLDLLVLALPDAKLTQEDAMAKGRRVRLMDRSQFQVNRTMTTYHLINGKPFQLKKGRRSLSVGGTKEV
jgi:hypothetical protein